MEETVRAPEFKSPGFTVCPFPVSDMDGNEADVRLCKHHYVTDVKDPRLAVILHWRDVSRTAVTPDIHLGLTMFSAI